MQADLAAGQRDIWAIDLSAEDMTVESLDSAALLGTTGSFACGASASCPVSSASTAGTIGSA